MPARKLFSLGAIVFVVSLCLSSQTLAQKTVAPKRVGLSAERLERIEELMQRHMDVNDFAGAVTLVTRDNKIAWFHAQGLMDIESKRPMQKDTVFRIMSMTKPVVAVSILMMVEEGRVRLTDPVSLFIPELGGLRVAAPNNPEGVAAERDITIKDLLTHTSGLMSGPASEGAITIEYAPGDTLASVVPRAAAAPLEFQPGTQWAYSSRFGFDTLARIVEITSGLDFATFVEQRIFKPLNMHDTYFYREEPHPNLATLYRSEEGQLIESPEAGFVNGTFFSGGGGLHSTAWDYLQFALMLLNDGELNGTRLLGRRTVERMRSAFIPSSLLGRNPGEGYGLGVLVVTDPPEHMTWVSEGTFGWSGAYNTYFFIDPVERIVAIYLTQSAYFIGGFTLMEDFETAVMQAVVE